MGFFENKEGEKKDLCIVRVKTDYWHNKKGAYTTKRIIPLKRQCKGYNILFEDCSDINAEHVIQRIENLYTVKDGVYELIVINILKDWETSYICDYEYKLMPLAVC